MLRRWRTNISVCLLDSNILIALATPDHSHHGRASEWFREVDRFATCPITQGALVRFHMRFGVQPSIRKAKLVLDQIARMQNHEFWADDIDYRQIAEKGIVGYKQVTDAYLVALATAHAGVLATLDEGLVAFHSNALLI
jgi:toxin-antitoxin system PIN domain toxin